MTEDRYELEPVDPRDIVIRDATGDLVHLFRTLPVPDQSAENSLMMVVDPIQPNTSAIKALCESAAPAVYVLNRKYPEPRSAKRVTASFRIMEEPPVPISAVFIGTRRIVVTTDVKWCASHASKNIVDHRAARYALARIDEIPTVFGAEFLNPFTIVFATPEDNVATQDKTNDLYSSVRLALADAAEFKHKMDTACT